MIIVGIDPGRRGGIATFKEGKFYVEKMPTDVLEIGRKLKGTGALVFVEKLNLRRDDLTGGKAYRVQKMLRDYERLKAGLEDNGVTYVMVHPMKWQTYLGVHLKGIERDERKRRYKEIAQRLFPRIKVTLGNADALLILVFGLRALRERPEWVWANCPVKEGLQEIINESKNL